MAVVIVGSMAFDTIETPFDRKERVLGGSCTYGAIAASLFDNPKIVGVVGDDFKDEHLDILKSKGVDTAGVSREKGKSFFWEGKYHLDMNTRETIKTELNVFEKFDPKIPENYKEAGFLFLANIDPELQLKVLSSMQSPDFVVCDTMNLWIDIKKEKLEEVFRRVDCVVLNDEEVRQYTGKANLLTGAKEIQKAGVTYVIIKKGEHGASILGPEGFYFSAPSFPVENVTDPTGAGDSFAGAFIGYIASAAKGGKISRDMIKKAVVYGNAVASYTVEGFSIDRLSSVSMKKIDERIEEIRNITLF